MLQAASRPELDSREIEELVKSEPSICYRLLRYLNSSLFGLSGEIHSVRHALTLLGERETRRWLHLVATLAGGRNKTSALILAALVRARFCELLGMKSGQRDSDLFLMGLLSLMDAILDMPMAEIMKSVSLDPECKAALLSNAGSPGMVYQLVLAQEAGNWPRVAELAEMLHMPEPSSRRTLASHAVGASDDGNVGGTPNLRVQARDRALRAQLDAPMFA